MPINEYPRGRAVSKQEKRKKYLSLFLLALVVIGLSWVYAVGMTEMSAHYCAGEFNTPQCRKDRAAEKAASYEVYKRQP